MPTGLIDAFRGSRALVAVLRLRDGAFLDVNPAFERETGHARVEVLGRRPYDLDLWPDLDVRAKIWGGLRGEGRVVGLPIQFRCRDGRVREARLDCELIEAADDDGPLAFALIRPLGPAPDAAHGGDADPGTYRALYLAAAEGIYRSLPGGGFIDVNPAMARIFGFATPDAMLRASAADTLALYADPAHGRALRARLLAEGRIEQVRSQVRRTDGSLIWISENTRVVRDAAGAVLFLEGSVVDISDRLAAEAALRQSEVLYKSLVDHCRDGVFLIQRGVVRFANRALAEMLRMPLDRLIGASYLDLVAPEDRAPQARRRAERESGSRALQDYAVTVLRGDGTRALFGVLADAVEYEGDIASTGVMRDITEERRRLSELAEAERKYRDLFVNSPVGLFRSSLDGTILEANPRLAQMLGYDTPEALKRAAPTMDDLYAEPDTRPDVVRNALLAGRIEPLRMQVRHASGALIWIEATARIETDADGRPVCFDGSVQDITARMDAELALKRSEAKYRALVEHAQVGVFISRGDRYVYVNRTFAAMLGYSEDALCAIPFRRLVAPEAMAGAAPRIAAMEQGQRLQSDYESCYLHRDGSRVHVTVSLGEVDVDGVPHMTGTVRDITRHRQVEQRLKFNASHDSLTGLCNRAQFQDRLGERLGAAQAGGRFDYAVLFLDLDGFKLVNDSLGHAAGDRLLVSIAGQLSAVLSEEALVARYGGDEFTILPGGPCDAARAVDIAQRVLALFERPFDIGDHTVFSGASLGIVLGSAEYRSPDQVLRDADTAMYRAKASGKAGYVIFDEAMHAAARARLQLETDLRLALERNEFRVHFQPIVSLRDGWIQGCEALMRWQHPVRGLLPPSEFLQVAEEIGLIAEMDLRALADACRQVAEWQRRHPTFAGLRLHVNMDERQLARPRLDHEIRAILDASGLAPASLSLEITETVFRDTPGMTGDTLQSLKALGVSLVVDDFGTGYSSLESFAASPFDALKIDRGFVRDMESNPRHRAIVRTIAGFADDLGLEITAEGVETPGQAALLDALGCEFAQGYLYARPLPGEGFAALLDRAETLGQPPRP